MTHTPTHTPLVLVDGSNLLWRAAFGFPTRVMSSDGRDITGLFGFFALLRKALRLSPRESECLVIFDSETAWHGRQEISATYKQHRVGAKTSPFGWLTRIQDGLTAQHVQWQESGDWEADDVIATLAAGSGARETILMSTDRDFHQLIEDRSVQLNTARGEGERWITEQVVRDRFGISPSQWCDYLALRGDPSDGIPGVPGIGPVRAATLLSGGARLEDLSVQHVLASKAGRYLLHGQLSQALRTRALVRFNTRVPVQVCPTGIRCPELPLAGAVVEDLGEW